MALYAFDGTWNSATLSDDVVAEDETNVAAFYDAYDTGDDYLGLSPDADQSLAGSLMMLEGSLVTIVALAWLFLRMAQEGEVRQELIEKGVDERTARRAVRYRRWEELA